MTTEKHTPKKAYHHGDLRQALLDHAALIIREDGEKGLSMRKLAARAGVSRSAPYHHFIDKQTLLCAIAEEGFRRFSNIEYKEVIDNGMIAFSVIHEQTRHYVTFAQQNPEYYDLMFGGHLWKSQQLSQSLIQEAHASFRHSVDMLRQWQLKGIIAQDLDPLRHSQVSWSTLHGISRLLIDGIYVDEAAIEAICESAATMHWEQLTGRKRG